MARINTVSYGSAFAATAGYLVNGGSVEDGNTTIPVDSGSGGIAAGSVVRFAGHDGVYVVKTGLTGGNIVLNRGLEADVADDSAVSVLALTQVDDVLDEGLEIGDEETVDYSFADGELGMDGVRIEGQFYAIGDDLPAVGTRAWIRYFSGGRYFVLGGRYGCRIRRGKSGPKKLGDGPPYECVKYTSTGSASGDTIQNT